VLQFYSQQIFDLFVADHKQEGGDHPLSLSGVSFPDSPSTAHLTPVPQPNCLTSEVELVQAIESCTKSMYSPFCLIDICCIKLTLTGTGNITNESIKLSNKNIVLSCKKSCPMKRCIIIGMGISRLFYGSNSNVMLLNFILVNGFHPNDGGSIKLAKNCNRD
jgi:hypothetical protein